MLTALPRFRFAVRLLAIGLWAAFHFTPAAAAIKVGDTFPDLASFKLEGKLPESLKGKVLMIDFWASWCDPCRESFPVMDELQKRYGPKGLAIIAVNVDENRADMEDFLKKKNVSFTLVRDAAKAEADRLVTKTEIPTMPGSFLLDRAGKVRFVHTGFNNATKKKYEQEIESLLK